MDLIEGSPAWRIRHLLFQVSIPAAYAESEFDQKQFGYVMTGNRSLDAQLAAEQRIVVRNIESLVELHADGVDFRLVDPERSKVIYETIKEHLDDAQHYFNRIRIVSKETEEDKAKEAQIVRDLEQLAKLADAVYKVVRNDTVDDVPSGGLIEFLQQVSGRTIHVQTLTEQLNETKNTFEQFEDKLEKAALTRTQRWREGGF